MVHLIIFGVVLPLLLSTFVVSAWWRVWSPGKAPFRGHWIAGPIVLGIAWYIGTRGVLEPIRWPPVTATERLVAGGTILAALALAEFLLRDRWWWRSLVRLLGISALAAYVLWSRVGTWGLPSVVAYGALIGAVATAGAFALDSLGERRRREAPVVAMTILLTLVSVTLGLGGSVKFAQLTGILAAFTGPLIVLSFIRKDFSLAPGLTTVLLGIAVALLVAGANFAELSMTALVLLLMALMAPWSGWLVGNRSAWIEYAAVAVLLIGLGGAAVGLTAVEAFAEADAGDDLYDLYGR